MNIKVSIIMPTWKGAEYIYKSIESVLSQTFLDWELIIIDDGLYTDTKDRIQLYTQKDKRIIFIKNKSNLGLEKTLNKGIREAKGEYIARIDDDDEWIDVDKLKKQVEFLNINKDYGLVGIGGIIVVNNNLQESFRYKLPKTDKEIRNKILYKNCFVHSSVLFRKEVVLFLGGYDESGESKYIEDYSLWLKIGLKSKFCNLDIFGVKYMLNPNSISSLNKIKQFKQSIKIVKKYKEEYPYYIKSMIINYIKLWGSNILIYIPSSVKNIFFKIFKEF